MKTLKKLMATLMTLTTMMACTGERNPLIEPFETPFQTPPFGDITKEHFLPAFKASIEDGKKEVESIANSKEQPSFANTIEALAYSGQSLSQVSRIFYNLLYAETNEGLQQIAREVSPMVTDYQNDILFNGALFKRIKTVYEQKSTLELTPEQTMLLEKTYKGFSRNGANLSPDDKEKMRVISRELSELSLRFNDNVLAETNGWYLHINDDAELAGLPRSSIDAAAIAAKSKNLEGWVITLDAPSFGPFLRYSDQRDLREKVYMAFSTRGYKENEYNNVETITRIANLRLERARLLGYDTHASFVLEESMAQNPTTVDNFLQQLSAAALPVAQQELRDVQAFAASKGFDGEILPWDWSYWAEKLRQEKYDFDEELTRPYFKLENVVEGVFALTERLFGLTYKANGDIPVYHPDVTAYEVYDAGGKFLSVLYLDFFPREGKSGGAWMTNYREQYKKDGVDFRPHVSLVCNFTKPTETKPSLLTFNEFNTFLHEFGHGLHGMLSDVTYENLSGTNVYRDFVELPSQILENWATEKEFLDMFARHYETGEAMPVSMVEKIIEVQRFHAAYAAVRQLGFGLNDMAWHTITGPVAIHPEEFEKVAMKPVQLFPRIDGTMVSTAFSHIFSGGYSAGYYSYKWAEVLDADAYQAFKENGIFDQATAKSFRDNILSRGGTEHPLDLYVKFRGKQPTIDAMLKRDGLNPDLSLADFSNDRH